MAVYDEILNFTYVILMIPVFIIGFNLARHNLAKVSKIEERPFSWYDWTVSVAFGVMFTVVIVFCINITIDFITPNLPTPVIIPPVGRYLLWIAIGILILYPFGEMFYLARPTTGVDTGYHRFIEAHIINKLRGNTAYIVCAVILLLTYGLPIFLIAVLFGVTILQAGFLWIVIVPLIYLNYFAAAGAASNVIKYGYPMLTFNRKYPGIKKFQTLSFKFNAFIKFCIYFSPLILAVIGIYTSFSGVIQGNAQKAGISAYLSLITTVGLGILGFFRKYWNKKSKTRIVDFAFAGYIMIAIMMNILINFMSIQYKQVLDLFNITNPVFGDALLQVENLLKQPAFTLPIITVQDLITVSYTIVMLFRKNSEFQANTRLNTVMNSYDKSSEKQLARMRKLETRLQNISDKEAMLKIVSKKLKAKEPNYTIIMKSIVLDPGFDRYGVDVNEPIREKARQYIELITEQSSAKPELIKKIIDFLQTHTLEKVRGVKHAFLSPQAFAALGELGKLDPGAVIEPLIGGLSTPDDLKRRYILLTLGLLGGKEGTLNEILSKPEVKQALNNSSFEVKNSVIQSVMAIGMSVKDVRPVLDALQLLLDESIELALPQSEYLVETLLQPLYKLSMRQPRAIDIDKMIGLLDYQPSFAEQDTNDYILLMTIRIIASLVYYHPDEVPVERLMAFANDKRDFIRYVAIDALGHLIMSREIPEILSILVKKSLEDEEKEVRDKCNEKIVEHVINEGAEREIITIDGLTYNLIEYYLEKLSDDIPFIAENASDALKTLAKQYPFDIHKSIEQKIAENDECIIQNCVYVLGTLDDSMKKNVNLTLLYDRLGDTSNETKCEILRTLGFLGMARSDVDVNLVASFLTYEQDADVRLDTAFALGKIGTLQPVLAMHFLIEALHRLDLTARNLETELIYEALGVIGSVHPFNEIIEELEIGIMSDTNPFIKDVIAKALYLVGVSIINADIRGNKEVTPTGVKEHPSGKMEYRPGNIIMILVNALQLKRIPDTVVVIISDIIQDLLPYFLALDSATLKFVHLDTLKQLLVQAYNSNYSHGILEAINRINSLKAFRMYMHEPQSEDIKSSSKFYAKQYTRDGDRFYDQGMLFKDIGFDAYAIESFKIALELSPNEYFSPSCHQELGMLFLNTDKGRALEELELASNAFAFFEDITQFKTCKQLIEEIQARE
ncbi:MAG TPA: hypothetical protein VKM55_23930 [Candidatus Lokiarchaeia archaeon]|nr:hypothetical protein [Candidatus Lokiarchaeia archaeon]